MKQEQETASFFLIVLLFVYLGLEATDHFRSEVNVFRIVASEWQGPHRPFGSCLHL